MGIKGIDVSQWQGNIDWSKVKASGIEFAILREGYRKTVDDKFLQNAQDAKTVGIPILGVYHFIYTDGATIAQNAQSTADNIKKAGIDPTQTMIFADLEYDTWEKNGEACTMERCSRYTKEYLDALKKLGCKRLGIYANLDYYQNYYTEELKSEYPIWLADYEGENDFPCIVQQYSSKGKVSGISGKVDMNYLIDESYLNKEDEPMGLWEKTKQLLDAQVGYLEKRSNSNLDSKTGNAGYNNYTKYSRDVNSMGLMGCQGQPWCATYQFWICAQILGKQKALEIMGNGFYNCNSVKAHAKSKGTWHSSPKLGALVIFRNGAHIGRVISISGNTIHTNEGNTSSGSLNTVEANGGCVAEKRYTIGNSQIDGYVWIDYGESEDFSDGTDYWKATGTATATVDNLFVRAYPNGEIIGELMKGNRFEVNGVTSGNWTQVNVANIGVGWVWTGYTKKDGVQTAEPPKQEITNKQDKTQRLFVGKVTASALNVRTWAGTEFPQIKSYPTLGNGNLVDVMNYTQTADDGSKWYYIRIAGKYHGFVSAKYIERQ